MKDSPKIMVMQQQPCRHLSKLGSFSLKDTQSGNIFQAESRSITRGGFRFAICVLGLPVIGTMHIQRVMIS
ncbi:hypothetical protein ACLOJK_041462 [Asimina triloba]